jgi:hypothetical protein
MLDKRLEEQLKNWNQIKNEEVPKVNSLIKQADLPALSVAEPGNASSAPGVTPTPTIPILPNESKPPAMPTASPPR